MIKKAIIPVAGLASRFLPASKCVPKTMFPIIDKPIVQLLVEEAIEAGIEEVALILSPRQTIVRQYFTPDTYLEEELKDRGKEEAYKKVKRLNELAKFHFFTQDKPLGDGHAITQAADFIEDGEACLVLFGDELICNPNGPNAAEQLIALYNKVNTPIIGVQEIDPSHIDRYGIIETNEDSGVKNMVEKPSIGSTSSNLAVIGKYIINSEVIRMIGESSSGTKDGELRLIDGLKSYLLSQKIHAHTLDGNRFDTGNKFGFLKANVFFALADEETRDDMLSFLQHIENLR